MLGLILAFLLGGAAGFAYARTIGSPTAAVDVKPSAVDLAPDGATAPLAAPNKKARKAGLTEADFTPSDDILEKLRLAEAGQLDPTQLAAEATEAKATTEPKAKAQPKAALEPESADRQAENVLADPALTAAERRVLERLRRTAGEVDQDDGSPGT